MTAADYTAAYTSKVLGQIELVRQGLDQVAADGSFTLITGILAREPIVTGAAASMAGGALEAFVRAAAIEIAPQRINAVSPSVFTEALDAYGDYFPGFPAVPLAEVGQAYVRSVESKRDRQGLRARLSPGAPARHPSLSLSERHTLHECTHHIPDDAGEDPLRRRDHRRRDGRIGDRLVLERGTVAGPTP